jgi:hypothetical protein
MKQNKFQKAVSGVPSASTTVWVQKPVELHAYTISKQGILPDWLVYALKHGKAKRLEGEDGSLKGFYVKVITPTGPTKLWAGKSEVIMHEANDDKCERLAVITEKSFRDIYITKRALMIQEMAERFLMTESNKEEINYER